MLTDMRRKWTSKLHKANDNIEELENVDTSYFGWEHWQVYSSSMDRALAWREDVQEVLELINRWEDGKCKD